MPNNSCRLEGNPPYVKQHTDMHNLPEIQDCHYHCWQLPCSLKALNLFTQSLQKILQDNNCSEECQQALDLVTEELLVNTIKYGFPDNPESAVIEVLLWINTRQALLVLYNNGIAFNPLQARERADEDIGGWGIPLVKSLMDRFEYERSDNRNKITLVRYERENLDSLTKAEPWLE